MNEITEKIIVMLQKDAFFWNGSGMLIGVYDPTKLQTAGVSSSRKIKQMLAQNKKEIPLFLEDVKHDEDLKQIITEIFGKDYEKQLLKRKI